MLNIVYWSICVFFFIQSVTGKSIDFESAYQEIEDKTNILIPDTEENEQMREDRFSNTALEDICKYFGLPLNEEETDPQVKCLQRFLDDTREIKLVKRDLENKETFEGSGDFEDQETIGPIKKEEANETLLTMVPLLEESVIPELIPAAESSSDITLTTDTGPRLKDTTSLKIDETTSDGSVLPDGDELNNVLQTKLTNFIKEEANPVKILKSGEEDNKEEVSLNTTSDASDGPLIGGDELNKGFQTQLINLIKEEANPVKVLNSEETSTNEEAPVNETSEVPETPVLFKNGFDEILKSIPQEQHNTSIKEEENHISTTESRHKENVLLADSNNGTSNIEGGEISKAGESQEESTSASPNNILLLVFAALGIVGTLAFAFNYIKKKREEREVTEMIKLEEDGRELKEIKPLIKSPLAQNGARSMEYIDADPQDEVENEIRAEMNQDLQNVKESKSQI